MLHACVLAGGRSSRMGKDKAELELEGKPLLQRATELLEAAGADVVMISGRQDVALGFDDLLPSCGPPGGLYSTLKHIKDRHGLEGSPLLLIPVDMPLLTVPTLQTLLIHSRDVKACHFAGEVFPCVVQTTPELYDYLRELFEEADKPLGGKRSMKGIFEWLQARALPAEDIPAREFMNVNTPEDWQAIQSAIQEKPAEATATQGR